MMETVSSTIQIDAAPDAILNVLLDFESYPDWARGVKEAEVLTTDDDGRPLEVSFEVHPGPLPTMRYVLRYTHEPNRLAWDYVRGDMKDIRGSYDLKANGDRTAVEYHLALEPSIRLPGFVKARAAREITRVALDELKRRVETGT